MPTVPVLNREAVMAALFARLVAKLGANVTFTARRYYDYDAKELNVESYPAMLVIGARDSMQRDKSGRPASHYLSALIILYVNDQNQDDTTQPETILWTLVGQIEQALQLDNTADYVTPEAMASNATTLGKPALVRYAWIRDIEIHHGAGGGIAGATIAVDMLAVDS